MADVISEARRAKERAMLARDLGEFIEATEILQQAEKTLLEELTSIGHAARGEAPGEYETSVRKQLSHIRGSVGGVYRRAGDYMRSAKAYDAGYEIERDFVDSYNLTQRLVSRAMARPRAAASDEAVWAKESLRDGLREARQIIVEQIGGPRSKDEYAAADLLVVTALLGDPDWRSCLQRFASLASRSSYARAVTRELSLEIAKAARANDEPAPDMAARFEEAAASL